MSVSEWNTWPAADELAPQLMVVLDDAVVDNGDPGALAGLDRMGVRLDDAAVGGPACVGEAVVAGWGLAPTAARSTATLPTRRVMSMLPLIRQIPAES